MVTWSNFKLKSKAGIVVEAGSRCMKCVVEVSCCENFELVHEAWAVAASASPSVNHLANALVYIWH